MNDRTQGAQRSPSTAVTRRKWLGSLLRGGSIVAAGGALALVRTSGYDVAPHVRTALRALTPWQFVVISAVARRMVAPDRAEGVPSPDEVGVAEFVDAYLVDMRPQLRRDLLRLLRYLEQLAPVASGFAARFTDLAPRDQDDVLRGLEQSRVSDLRAGFQALKSLVMLGYYRDPRTFSILGYAGPFVIDPAGPAP